MKLQKQKIRYKKKKTDFGRKALLVIDDHSPAEIEFLVLDLDESSGLKERQRVRRMGHDFPEISRHLVELLPILVVLCNERFVRNHSRTPCLFFFSQFFGVKSIMNFDHRNQTPRHSPTSNKGIPALL